MTPISEYQTRGFLHLPGVLADVVEDLREALVGRKSKDSTWVVGQRGGIVTSDSVHRQPVWAQAVNHPEIRGLVDAILGGPSFCQTSMLIVKPAQTGQRFPWHQDSAYYGDAKLSFVLGNVYLDDVTAENGSITFVPGSHTRGRIPHLVDKSAKRYLSSAEAVGAVLVPAQAGDVTLFDHHCVHGSQPNTSDQPRRAVRLVYQRVG